MASKVMHEAPLPRSEPRSSGDVIHWDVDVPLWTSPLIVGATFRVFAIAAVGLATLLSLVFAIRGEFDSIGMIWLAMAASGIGLFGFSLLIMAVLLGNRLTCDYTIDRRGIEFSMTDRRARTGNWLLLIAGLLRGNPAAVGAGEIARAQEMQTLRWRGAFSAEFRPRRHLVVLRNRWRQLMLVQATAENYAQVAARIAAELQHHGTAERMPTRSPLPRYLLQSALVVCASLPLFGLVETFDVWLLLPLLQLFFGLATVWLIGLFGFVLLALDGVIVLALLLHAGGEQESWLHRGEHFARWTIYSDQDWGLLLLAAIAMAVFAWVGWRGIRGHLPSMLMADFSDSGE